MVKKSFLGRLFGKKKIVEKGVKNKGNDQGFKATGTATATKKGIDTPLSSRVGKTGPRNRFEESKEEIIQERPRTVTPSQGSDDQSKEQKPKVKVEKPKVITPTKEVEFEDNEKIDVIAKKMTAQEEASIKISDGIKGLSSILSNIDQRLDEQTQQGTELVKHVKIIPEVMKDLPESSRAGVELLQTIGQVLENQSRATANLSAKISGLPDLLNGMKEKIDEEREKREEERETIKESFKESVNVMASSLQGLEQRQNNLSAKHANNSKQIVDSLKVIQSNSQSQIDHLIEKNRMTNRLIVLLIFVLGALLVGVIASLAGITVQF